MKRKVMISTLLAGILLSTSALYANVNDAVASKEAKALNNPNSVKAHAMAQADVQSTRSKDAFRAKMDMKSFTKEARGDDAKRLKAIVSKEATQHRLALKKAPKEVTEGLQQTVVALRALHQNKIKPAKEALEKATKLFDKALKKDPQLALVPIADEIRVNDFTGDAKLVKHIINAAQSLLKDHDTQAARNMLLPLQDEMDMTTQFIPMGTYPVATKEALKMLNKGNSKLAFSALATALNSVVTQVVVVPLPLITAQDLVLEASKLDKSNKKDALKLLSSADDELEKAVLLGYTKEHSAEYKSLQTQVKNIEAEIRGKNIVAKLYDHIKNDFKSLVSKHEKEHTVKKH